MIEVNNASLVFIFVRLRRSAQRLSAASARGGSHSWRLEVLAISGKGFVLPPRINTEQAPGGSSALKSRIAIAQQQRDGRS